MKLRIHLAAVAATCVLLALPAVASAEGGSLVLGFQVTSVDAGKATGIMHCVDAGHAGQQATFQIGPNADASVLTPGAMVGVRIEDGQIAETRATPPCDAQLGERPTSGREGAALPEGTDDPAAEPGAGKPNGKRGDGQANDGPGDHHGPFMPGFQNRIWRFGGSANGFDNGQLSMTLEKILNLPKRFRSQDDDLIDQDAIVLVGPKTRIRTKDGDKATTADPDGADYVRVEGKLVPPKKWVTDEDGTPVTTIRARRVIIVSSATQG